MDFADGSEITREEVGIDGNQPALRARHILELGVDTLICGAISMPLEALLTSANVRVLGRACGPVEEVLQAFMTGRLADDAFLMPGCCGRRGRARNRRRGGRCRSDT